MGSIGIVSLNQLGEIEDRFTAEQQFQLLRCCPIARASVPAAMAGCSSDPLVGGLPIWERARIRGAMDLGLTRDDGSRTSPRTAVGVAWGPEVVSGFNPSYSILCWCCLAQIRFLR